MSCSQQSLGTWSCHLIARHGVHFIAGVNVALYVALERSVVDSGAEGLSLSNFRSRQELCVVIQIIVAKILFHIPNTLPLCGGSEGVHTGSLGRHVRGGLVDRLKYDQHYALWVSLGIQRSFREQNGMLISRSTKFVVECVMPDFSKSFQFVKKPCPISSRGRRGGATPSI